MAAKKTTTKKTAAKKTAPAAARKTAAKKAPAAAKKAVPAGKKTAAKTMGQRMTAKVSPLKGMSVEDFILQRLSGWQAEAARAIVKLVRDVAPEATHAVKWGQPIFEHNGPFAYVMPAKAHLTLGFWRGAELADPKGVLSDGGRMKHVKLKSAGEVDVKVLGAFVKEAVRLNREKGNPTMRSKK